jgi:hypothetical protein
MNKNKSVNICGPCGKEFTPERADQLYCSKECKNLGALNHKKTKKIDSRIEYLYTIINRPSMSLSKSFLEKAEEEIKKLRKKKEAIVRRF